MRKRTGNIQERGPRSFRIRYYDINGQRQEESVKGSREEAETRLTIRLGEVAQGLPVSSKPNTVTFEELAADVVNHYIVNELRSTDDIETRFDLHLNPIFGRRRAAQIATAHFNAYIVRRKAEGASNGSINRELEAAKRAYNLGKHSGKVLTVPHIPRLKEDNVRKGFFTRDEVDRLCKCLKKPYDGFVMFAFLTGWRKAEIQELEWSNVDFDALEVRLDPGTTKSGKGRVFPISEELEAILKAQIPQNHGKVRAILSGPVFRLNGKPIGEFRKTWMHACHKAKLPCVVTKEGKVVKALRIFHDLRRSAVRELVRNWNLSEREAMILTGHQTRSVFDRYSVVSTTDLEGIRTKLNRATNRAKAPSRTSGNQ